MEFTTNDVVIVNEKDEWLGAMPKIPAHKEGILHRALSIFILNGKGELLLQQRAAGKYHSGGLWSNTCCSHPIPHESTINAAHRRLKEEMGFDCELEEVFILRYKASVDNGLIENEYDHVYAGYYDGEIKPDPTEVQAYKFIPLDQLSRELEMYRSQFTAWLHLAMPKFKDYLESAGEHK